MMRAPSPSPQSRQQQEFLRQQAEYKARQQEAERIQQQQLAAQAAQQAAMRQQEQQQQPHSMSVKDTVRDIIANTDFSSFDPNALAARERRVIQVCTRKRPIHQIGFLNLFNSQNINKKP